LGMPLHRYDKLLIESFDGFNYPVLRTPGNDSQTVPWARQSLMMTAVHDQITRAGDLSQPGALHESDVMRVANLSARLMIHCGAQILDQSSSAPHVPCLEAVAYPEQRLMQVGGILHQQFVDCFAGGIVGSAAWKQDAFTRRDQPRDFGLCGTEGDFDGNAA